MRLAAVSAFALAAVVGGMVLAHANEGHEKHGFMRQHVSQRIDAALDAAKVTPEQRATIEKSRDRVFAAMEASHKDRRAHMEKVLELFQADKVDAAQLQSLRAWHENAAKVDAEAVTQAIVEAHDTLQPQQRGALAAHLRANKPEGPPKMVADWMKKRAMGRVTDALNAVKATEVQRAAVDNALEQVFNSMHEEMQASSGHMDEALKLFETDKIEQAQIDTLRGKATTHRQKIGDAIVQAFHDVHDTLTSAQRKQLVDWVRANHPHLGG